VVPAKESTYPIDLPAALRLAESINPTIGAARARIGEALAYLQQARVLLLPTLNAGGNYHGHNGVVQRSAGNILAVSSQSLYFGGGARAVAQNTIEVPAVLVASHLTDAFFEPLAARQHLTSVGFDATATANTVLLGVALDYVALQGTIALLKARERTASEAAEVARITTEYARTGEGRKADADRAATEWRLRRADVRSAEGQVAMASARLVHRLHLDQTVRMEPVGDPLQVFTLIDPDVATEDLLKRAVHVRPEILARSADVARAEYRLQQERLRPLLPTLWLGFSGGAYGGGSNITPPLLANFAGRADFDVVLYWTLQNLGMGNLSLQKQRGRQRDEADGIRVRAVNLVRDEVAAAKADVLSNRQQIAVTLEEIKAAHDGFLKDLKRIQGAAGPPLETLDNLRYLARSRESLIEAVVGYNQAQFRLWVALGSPPPLEGATEPTPPAGTNALIAMAPTGTLPDHSGGSADPTSVQNGGGASSTASSQSSMSGGPDVRVGLESLSRAHHHESALSVEQDRIQERLLKGLVEGGSVPDRKQFLEDLRRLADLHREEAVARAEYDRALWLVYATVSGGNVEDSTSSPDRVKRQAGSATPIASPLPNSAGNSRARGDIGP
jgi:outer membrane protein TolC